MPPEKTVLQPKQQARLAVHPQPKVHPPPTQPAPKAKHTQWPASQECAIAPLEQTIQTGLASRGQRQPQDDKTTVKKKAFEGKALIREFNRKLRNLSSQCVPEYFVAILEYLVERDMVVGCSPDVEAVNRWRLFMQGKVQAQELHSLMGGSWTSTSRTGTEQEGDESQELIDPHLKFSVKEGMTPSSCFPHVSPPISPQQPPSTIGDDTDARQPSNQHQPLQFQEQVYHKQTLLHNLIPATQFNTFPSRQQLSSQWNARYDKFAQLVQHIYRLLGENECEESIFPTCYFFYCLVVADQRAFDALHTSEDHTGEQMQQAQKEEKQDQGTGHGGSAGGQLLIEYYLAVSILIATKYHDIYPASAEELIDCINSKLSYDRVLEVEGQALEMLQFRQFFDDNESRYLRMFVLLCEWSSRELSVCQFIMESGLNNPKLYSYPCVFKAAAVIGLYEDRFNKNQEKFMAVKNLCPGLSLSAYHEIRRQYSSAVVYNYKNQLYTQKRKYFIFDKQMRSIIRGS